MRLWVACLFLVLAGCQKSSVTAVKEEAKDETLHRYALHGEVLRLDPQGKIAAIKHQKIGDWMEAMTMEFPVKDQADSTNSARARKSAALFSCRALRTGSARFRKTPGPRPHLSKRRKRPA
jgi:Cu/Ag efflux protein CusF